MKNMNIDLIKKYLEEDKSINGSGSVERLSVKAKVSPSVIRSLVRGDQKGIQMGTLERIAEAIGTDLVTLLSKAA